MTRMDLLIRLGLIAAVCVVVFIVAAIRLERRQRKQDDDVDRMVSRYGGE